MRRRLALALALALASGCQPTLDSDPARIDAPRVLAVVADPPEAAPGARVTLRALAVSPDGTLDDATLMWSFCARGRGAAENNSVDGACLAAAADGPSMRPIAGAPAAKPVEAVVPDDACSLFGSEPPPPDPGEPPLRPADPDASGGYYQPVAVDLAAASRTFGHVRIACALPRAPADVARDFAARYVHNHNPQLERIDRSDSTAGAAVTLTAHIAADAAEDTIAYDVASARLRARRERLTVSWFASSGRLTHHLTPVAPDSSTVTNTWTADGATIAYIWVVLHDDRGGLTFLGVTL